MLVARAMEILRKEGVIGLARRLERRFARSIETKHSATTVSHREAMAWFERRKDGYDRLISAIVPYVTSDAVVFDIGANIGYFTLVLAERLSFKGSAYLFEPVPHLAALCKATFANVPFSATVFDFGLSDKATEEDIFVADDGNLGWNTLIREKASSDMKRVGVRLRRFDDCGISVQPSLIKIDVEGSEYRVFRGMAGSFRRWKSLPVILCEVGWGTQHPAWAEQKRVFEEMERLGYSMYGLDGSLLDEDQLQGTTDVLFLPRRA